MTGNAATLITETLPGRTLTRGALADHLTANGINMSGHALMLVCGLTELHGLICSGPTRDGQHTYALLSKRVPFTRHLDPDHARAELVLRYIGGHGPVTGRESAAGMLIVDSQLVGHMKRTLTTEHVTFDIHLLRPLTAEEHTAVQEAADRYGRYLYRRPQLRFA
jgi:hypothetical protein